MADLKTNYLGLNLKNPIIAGSSGLTNKIENLQKIEENGAGALVLKSLFEEQIIFEGSKTFNESGLSAHYAEANDYIVNYIKNNHIGDYLKLIEDAKKRINIPVIASINCRTSGEWTDFAKQIENAGADALELNVFVLPTDPMQSAKDVESSYFDIIEKVKNKTKLPISLKISYYFSGFAEFAQKISWTGINGLVLFNRFFSPDIDINTLKIVPTNVFSSPEELSLSLRWVAILSDIIHCPIAASTGIHSHEAVIKQLLAGASAVQVCSVLYKKGFGEIKNMLEGLESWMAAHKFNSLSEFKGKLSFEKSDDSAAYLRSQFMKHFAGIE